MKYLRLTILSLLFLGAIGALAGYFFFRRTVPVQARFIPRNAVLVLTADMRELALNAKGGGQLLPERGGDAVNKQLAALSRVWQDYKGGGVAQTADVQLFLFRQNESAWAGAAIELKDSAAFGKLMRSPELGREILLSPAGKGCLALDSSGAVLGWNADAALLLYPVGNHETAANAAMLAQLLVLPEANSIASNEEFCSSVLEEFDLSLWVNPAEAISFSQSAQLAALFGTMSQLHLSADFRDGEVLVKRHIVEDSQAPVAAQAVLSRSARLGFWHINTSTLYKHPAADLFFDDNELCRELAAQLTGQCTVMLNDTLHYTSHYTETVMDENFNTVQREVSSKAVEFGHTCVYTMKNEAAVAGIFGRAAAADSNLQQNKKAWTMATGTLRKTAWTEKGQLYVSTFFAGPFTVLTKTSEQQILSAQLQLPELLPKLASTHSDWPPQWLSIAQLLSKHTTSAELTRPVYAGNGHYSDEFRLSFTDTRINAMLQLRDLLRESAWLMQQK
ncbi:MAG: DUF4836 family protein [Bacteroidia bacterium]|jgi:hypothetical protein|nr:DUF4836 family protein [Bacteroidia bacterium]